jgi:hypothetical protein
MEKRCFYRYKKNPAVFHTNKKTGEPLFFKRSQEFPEKEEFSF